MQKEDGPGTKLDRWQAIDTIATHHPHMHIIICGSDDARQDTALAHD